MTTPLTPDTILAGSKVLAEFDGWEDITDKLSYPRDEKDMRFYRKGKVERWTDGFSYHESYDSLWPVWEKLRISDQSGFTEVQLCEFLQIRQRIATALAFDSIEKCFSLLVEAVEWLQKTKGGSDVH